MILPTQLYKILLTVSNLFWLNPSVCKPTTLPVADSIYCNRPDLWLRHLHPWPQITTELHPRVATHAFPVRTGSTCWCRIVNVRYFHTWIFQIVFHTAGGYKNGMAWLCIGHDCRDERYVCTTRTLSDGGKRGLCSDIWKYVWNFCSQAFAGVIWRQRCIKGRCIRAWLSLISFSILMSSARQLLVFQNSVLPCISLIRPTYKTNIMCLPPCSPDPNITYYMTCIHHSFCR